MMLKKIKGFSGLTAILFALTFSSCNKWVNEPKSPDSTVDESQLTTLEMLGRIDKGIYVNGPVIAGVWRAGATASSDLLVASGAIADEITSTAVPNSPFYKELDEDKLSPDNTSLFSTWSNIQNYRARAEDAIRLADQQQSAEPDKIKIKQGALLNARLHAGYAWMLLADYFTVSETNHAVYTNHNLISHEQAYLKAQRYWEEALTLANEQEKRLLHSLLTKLGIHTQNYALAIAHVNQSFNPLENFAFLNTVGTTSNAFFSALSINVRDAAVDPTLVAVLKTTADQVRNPVVKAPKGHWSLTLFKERDLLLISDFDEMQLIRAELAVRGLLPGNAVDFVNTVIVKYDPTGKSNLPASAILTLTDITALRRIYLSWRGTRLIDLRRFNIDGDLNPGFTKRKYHWIGVPEIETR
ncbi:hypothetical protein [Pedobacter cryoconitis]|uniref:SusD-like starch-binding protein associating with outer membrane n=1 Tax=Pedobacter cryoconitis TaxID=188932 RepID=A0A7X0J8G7_9SPHI|nr:hypothetical protein [Pedobacter cryoconitis]MBB6502993.1 hypothetical protein [Pedobacter cryoconitis]